MYLYFLCQKIPLIVTHWILQNLQKCVYIFNLNHNYMTNIMCYINAWYLCLNPPLWSQGTLLSSALLCLNSSCSLSTLHVILHLLCWVRKKTRANRSGGPTCFSVTLNQYETEYNKKEKTMQKVGIIQGISPGSEKTLDTFVPQSHLEINKKNPQNIILLLTITRTELCNFRVIYHL